MLDTCEVEKNVSPLLAHITRQEIFATHCGLE